MLNLAQLGVNPARRAAGVRQHGPGISIDRRLARSTLLCSAARVEEPAAAQPPEHPEADRNAYVARLWDDDSDQRAFPYPQPMDPITQRLTSVPLSLLYPAMAVAVGGAAMLGSMPGKLLPVEDEQVKEAASLGGAVILGAGTAYAAVQAKKKRESAALTDLYNTIVDLPEPYDLTPDMVDDCGDKYGVNMRTAELDGLCRLYSQYLQALIPTGDRQLQGDEAANLISFKESLGLSDEDAAACHVDVARRLYRLRSETRDRDQQFEQKKGFQRLVYVSQVVFGDVAAYLLSWRSHFELTEAQLYVARRDNAKSIFKSRWDKMGGDILADRGQLKQLRELQAEVKMFDESAEELVKEAQRNHIEQQLVKALDILKATGKNRDIPAAISKVEYVLTYCRQMDSLTGEEDMLPGLGSISVHGGSLSSGVRSAQLRDLYKTYLSTKVEAAGAFSAELDAEASQLAKIMELTAREQKTIRDEVAGKLYRRLLKEEVSSRRIDDAAEPAEVLKNLREQVRFDEEAATELHKSLYRTKMSSLIQKGRLTAGDQAELKRICRILCIPEDLATNAQEETCGRMLKNTINEIFMAGAKPVPSIEMQRIERCISDLAVSRDVALQVLSSAAREYFLSYLFQAEKERDDRREAASTIKKLVQFNLLVVSPMLDRVRGIDDAEHLLAPARSIDDDSPRGQSEITVVDDMDLRSRVNVYKNYLMYTMEGDVVELPVGGQFRKKNNAISRHAEALRLEQLATLLGLTDQEVESARHALSEDAFKAQTLDVMRSGPMTAERTEQLEVLRAELGVPEDVAARVIKASRAQVYGADSTDTRGALLTLERALAIHKAGGSIKGMAELPRRRTIFRNELNRAVSDGTGSLDADFMLKQLPQILMLEEFLVKSIVKELVGTRKRMLLVQAISQLRQRRMPDAMAALQNLLSCARVLPESQPMKWTAQIELVDLYAAYAQWESSSSKLAELGALIGLTTDEMSKAAKGGVSETSGSFSSADSDEEFFG